MALAASIGSIDMTNGVGGGGAISFYQKSASGNLDDSYGRLHSRMKTSGLKNHMNSFIWNQGENYAGDSVVDYKNILNGLCADKRLFY